VAPIPAGGSTEPPLTSAASDFALSAMGPDFQRAAIRSLSHLDDVVMDQSLQAIGVEVGAFNVVHSGLERAQPLVLKPEVEEANQSFNSVVQRDSIMPKQIGIYSGMRKDQKAAQVTKFRTNVQLAAVEHVKKTAGVGLHAALATPLRNLLSQVAGVSAIYSVGATVMKFRAEPFQDGIMSEQMLQGWSSGGAWRTHTRVPLRASSSHGPWAGTQDKACLLAYGLSATMGSQEVTATPVFYMGESMDDALVVEGNGEIPAIELDGKREERQISTTAALQSETREEPAVGQQGAPNYRPARLVPVISAKDASARRQEELEAGETDIIDQTLQGLLRPAEDGDYRTQAGDLSVVVMPKVEEGGPGAYGLVTFRTSVLYKIKGASIVCSRAGQFSCPELGVFAPEKLAEMERGINNGDVPSMLVIIAQLVSRLNQLAIAIGDVTSVPVPRTAAAAMFRYATGKLEGLGAENAALISFATTQLVIPDTTLVDPTEADLAWGRIGRCAYGKVETMVGAVATLKRVTGQNSFGHHSARTRLGLGTLSPVIWDYAMQGAFVRTPNEVRLGYERHSVPGIMAACKKLFVLNCQITDRAVASGGNNRLSFFTGVGFRDLGNGTFGRPAVQTQVAAVESMAQQFFRSKYSESLSVICDFTARQHASTALGSSTWNALRFVSVCGEPPERIPAYMWPVFTGDEMPYLKEIAGPDLSNSHVVAADLEYSELLAHGHVVSVTGGSLGRPLFATEPGTGPEDAANPPYMVVAVAGSRLGPATPNADGDRELLRGSASARRIDAAMVALRPQVAAYSRTMGSIPYRSTEHHLFLDTLVDLPMRRSSFGAQCLVSICVPQNVRQSIAQKQPVPVSAFASALSDIFR